MNSLLIFCVLYFVLMISCKHKHKSDHKPEEDIDDYDNYQLTETTKSGTESPQINLKLPPKAKTTVESIKTIVGPKKLEETNLRARPDLTDPKSGEQYLEEPDNLCENPNINAGDYMTDGTVWLYRDNYYWVLKGLPDSSPTLKGPFQILWTGMAPVRRNTHVMTVDVGDISGTTFRFNRDAFWAYSSRGMLFLGQPKKGMPFIVPDSGLTALFFNRNESNPMMIGFRGMKVYYYKFAMSWVSDGYTEGYVEGRYGENFPNDLDMSFSVPDPDVKDGYIAYLFKNGKYCKRPEKLKSGNTCDEWKDNRELYGCYSSTETTETEQTTEQKDETTTDDGIDVFPPEVEVKAMSFVETSISRSFVIKSYKTLILVSIFLYLKLN